MNCTKSAEIERIRFQDGDKGAGHFNIIFYTVVLAKICSANRMPRPLCYEDGGLRHIGCVQRIVSVVMVVDGLQKGELDQNDCNHCIPVKKKNI